MPSSSPTFPGFNAILAGQTRLPDAFFSDLLPLIDDLKELKITLYCFWYITQREGVYRYIRQRDLLDDPTLWQAFGTDQALAHRAVVSALEQAIQRGSLLAALLPNGETLYFVNGERGRTAISALKAGTWLPSADDLPVMLRPAPPNIFTLYEQNIGVITPMIADILRAAEHDFPAQWLAEAVQLAVERNIRNWRYIHSVLLRWEREGRDARGANGQGRQADEGQTGTTHPLPERTNSNHAGAAFETNRRLWEDD
jgi:DnaD/phage-associated family protein